MDGDEFGFDGGRRHEVLDGDIGVVKVEAVNRDQRQGGLGGGRRGVGGGGVEGGGDVVEIKFSVFGAGDGGEGMGEVDFVHGPAMLEEGGELQTGVKLVPAGKRRAVILIDSEAADGEGQGERVDFDLGNGDRPMEQGGEALEHLGLDDGRGDKEPGNGIDNQRAAQPEQDLDGAR